MPDYILNINKQDSSSGNTYELHDETPGACTRLPVPVNRLQVGSYANCAAAMDAARWKYPQYTADIDACHDCCPDSHRE